MGLLDWLRGRDARTPEAAQLRADGAGAAGHADDALHPDDVPELPDWIASQAWYEQWGPPSNIVVGEQRYQQNLLDMTAETGEDRCFVLTEARLVPEPGNSHDPLAIAVCIGTDQIGYLRRQCAAALDGQHLAAWTVPAVIRGGFQTPTGRAALGVHVWAEHTAGCSDSRWTRAAGDHHVDWPPLDEELDGDRSVHVMLRSAD